MNDLSPDLYILAIERICADDRARRELLYLRALEKGDLEAARDLEQVEPTLREGLEQAGVDLTFSEDEPDRERRERFGRSYDRTQDRHVKRLMGDLVEHLDAER